MDDSIENWLAAACADADRRGLAGLKPLLETLAKSTQALRDADRRDRERRQQADPAPPRTDAR